MAIEYTVSVPVWNSSPSWKSIGQLKKVLAEGDQQEATSFFNISTADMRDSGWVHVGNAVAKVTLFDEAELHGKQLDALNAELKTARAEAQQRENSILDRISKLQALTFDAPEAP